MSYQPKPNNGSLWANDKKEKDSHPDRAGSILLECPHCQKQWEAFLNGWLKKTPDGKPYLSVSVKPKQKRNGAPAASEGQQQPKSNTDF